MLTLSRLPVGLLALTVAAPVFAQPATTTTNPTPPAAAMAPAMPAAPKAPDSASRSTAAVPKAGLVDINTATAAELQALPGISERDSAKIIHGSPGSTQVSSSKAPSAAFNTNGEVVMRFGVSEATYDKIKDRIVARQQPKS